MNAENVRVGGLRALAHAVHLLGDAALLYGEGRMASSFVLAVSAREELGRSNLLWKRAGGMAAGEIVNHKELK
ncbi:MAG: AbiV family abortive infection protein, partial [Candidatus Methylomirabilales bacterium]